VIHSKMNHGFMTFLSIRFISSNGLNVVLVTHYAHHTFIRINLLQILCLEIDEC